MPLKIFIIRHPETIKNVAQIIDGPLNGELSEIGKSQIPGAVKELLSLGITKIYSSDSERCRELAETFSKESKIEINYDPMLREIDSGDWIGMRKLDVKKLIAQNRRPKYGEDLNQLMERAKTMLHKLALEEGRILLIAHGCLGKMLLGATINLQASEADREISLRNCEIRELDLKNIGLKLFCRLGSK